MSRKKRRKTTPPQPPPKTPPVDGPAPSGAEALRIPDLESAFDSAEIMRLLDAARARSPQYPPLPGMATSTPSWQRSPPPSSAPDAGGCGWLLGVGAAALAFGWACNAPLSFFLVLACVGGLVSAAFLLHYGRYRAAAAVTLGAAVVAGLVVLVVPPTWGGWTVSGAYLASARERRALDLLAPNACGGFRAGGATRGSLSDAYPNWLWPGLRAAEEGWRNRTLADLEARFAAVAPGDRLGLEAARGSAAEFRAMAPAAQGRLGAAERAWAGRTVDRALSEAEGLRAKDPLRALALLQQAAACVRLAGLAPEKESAPADFPAWGRLVAARQKSARPALEDAQRRWRQSVKEGRFQAALVGVREAEVVLVGEAGVSDIGPAVTHLRESATFVATQALRAGRTDPR